MHWKTTRPNIYLGFASVITAVIAGVIFGVVSILHAAFAIPLIAGPVALFEFIRHRRWLLRYPEEVRWLAEGQVVDIVNPGEEARVIPVLLSALNAPVGLAYGFTGWDGDHAASVAAQTLGDLRAKEAVGPLTGLVLDPVPAVRHAAIQALARIGDERAVPDLMEVCTRLRNAAARNTDTAVFRETVLNAVIALGELRDKRAADVLMEYCSEGASPHGWLTLDAHSTDHARNAQVFREIVRALGKIGDRRAVALIIPLLGRDGGYMLSAAQALESLGEQALVEAFDGMLAGSIATVDQLRGRPAVVEALTHALDSQYNDRACRAAWALGELHATDALPQLRHKAGLLSFEQGEVKRACREAITKLEAFAGLPRPAESETIDTSELPRRAMVSEPSRESLPRQLN